MKIKSDSFTRNADGIVHELRNLIAEAEKILSGDVLSRTSENAVTALRQQLRSAQEELANVYEDARRKVMSGARSADDAIRANPYQTIALTFGLGLVAGILVSRLAKD